MPATRQRHAPADEIEAPKVWLMPADWKPFGAAGARRGFFRTGAVAA